MRLELLLANVMNRFMGLSAADQDWGDAPQWVRSMIKPLFGVLDWLLPVVMILLGFAGVIYVIVLSVKFAKAESADAKDAAKKQLINVAVALIIMLVALVVVFIFIKNAADIFDWVSEQSGTSS